MSDEELVLDAPVRADGTPRSFWFDRQRLHIIHLHKDGTAEAIGWDCRHPVRVRR